MHLNGILLLMAAQQAVKNKEGRGGNKSRRAISPVRTILYQK
jgi:hypothetical protein